MVEPATSEGKASCASDDGGNYDDADSDNDDDELVTGAMKGEMMNMVYGSHSGTDPERLR